MTLTLLSLTWAVVCVVPCMFLLGVPLIWLDEHLKRRRVLRRGRQPLVHFS